MTIGVGGSVLQNFNYCRSQTNWSIVTCLKPRTFVEDCLEQHASKNKEAKELSTLEHTSSAQLNDGN